MNEVVPLYRYWIWANRLRELFDDALAARGMASDEDLLAWFADDAGLLMSHWYVALYVVVEGYRELGLHDLRTPKDLKGSPNATRGKINCPCGDSSVPMGP